VKNRMDSIFKDLPDCFARLESCVSTERCASCALKQLCEKVVYKSDLIRAMDDILEKIAEIERVDRRIESILGLSNDVTLGGNNNEE